MTDISALTTNDLTRLDAAKKRSPNESESELINRVCLDYIFSDEGAVAPSSAFDGLTTGPAFKNELLKWNYEQIIEATEFQGRKIDLVVEPKILIKSGLIP